MDALDYLEIASFEFQSRSYGDTTSRNESKQKVARRALNADSCDAVRILIGDRRTRLVAPSQGRGGRGEGKVGDPLCYKQSYTHFP